MKVQFTKMQGCGNDYIYFNCFWQEIPNPEALSVRLSDRHFGIGGDGVVLICRSETADAKMRMFNLDGSEGKMCGNAIRCVAKYLYDNGLVRKNEMTIETLSGIKTLQLTVQNGRATAARVNMGKAELDPGKIPVAYKGPKVVDVPIEVGGRQYRMTCVSMGNPHAVVFCHGTGQLELEKIGPLFEHHEQFPEGVNTEFVQVEDSNTLRMRVWERGSGETLACGTGACAAASAAVLNGLCRKDEPIHVRLAGGELLIQITDEAVFMTGPCVKVFDGIVEV